MSLVIQQLALSAHALALYVDLGLSAVVVERDVCLSLFVQFQVGVPVERPAIVRWLLRTLP